MEKTQTHPLENIFNLEEGSTAELFPSSSEIPIETKQLPSTYDEGDAEIHDQAQQIYRLALAGFEEQSATIPALEGKYKSRAAEVAAQYLTIALNSVNEKSKLKQHKDKLKKDEVKIETEAVISMDRNHLLREILKKQTEPKDITIDSTRTDTSK